MSIDKNNEKSKNQTSLYGLLASADPIPAEQIQAAMKDPLLEIQSEIYNFVMTPESATRIVPRLKIEDYEAFALRYLARCIIENPPDDLAHTRWAACYEFANVFSWLWTNTSAARSGVVEAKNVLRRLYLDGDSARNKALTQGTLEHIFENSLVRDFFADWTTAEPMLRVAYIEASEWSKKGGHSPFWKKVPL